jgi:hypothetical protein
LFGLQNINMNISLNDVFGFGLIASSISMIIEKHERFMQSLSPRMRYAVTVWEMILLTVIIWQIVRLVSYIGLVFDVFYNASSDVLGVIEYIGHSIDSVIGKLTRRPEPKRYWTFW